ncbi:MAG: hypothetical protein RLY30_368 [Pseudomonadota bacterium]|jgi:chemotaxis signal transduction protein
MAIYLQVCAGPLYLMLAADGVHEVTTLDRLGQSERGYVEWREMVLPLVSVAEFFELTPDTADSLGLAQGAEPAAAQPVVIYSPADEADAIAFLLDEVLWLKELPAQAWLALPPVPARTRHFFDAIMSFPETGHQAFRLRRPLRPLDFRSAGGWMMASEAVLEGQLEH